MRQAIRKQESFEEFLKTKQLSKEKHLDWQGRKDLYLKSVDHLYAQISKWLKPFLKKSLMNIADFEMEICEPMVGSYKIKRRDIFIGRCIVSLVPQGTFIVGCVGRVDIRGSKGSFTIVESDWNEWKMGVRTIASSTTWAFNKQSFQRAFRDVINGYDEDDILE